MVVFKFDEVDQLIQSDSKIEFLKLEDDGWYANVRFMYGPGETFEWQSVHNVSEDPKKPKFVPCLRGQGQPLEVCPLCTNGSKINAQCFMPVYVISIVSKIHGYEQEQPVGKSMLFQRGATFKGAMQGIIRQSGFPNRPIVNTTFRLVRNGKKNDPGTNYTIEIVGVDDVGLEQLPPRVEVAGSYILPNVDYQTMVEKYVNKTAEVQPRATQNTQTPVSIQPRTLNMNSFAGNTVGLGQTQTFNQPINTNQAPVQAPVIGNGQDIPF